MHEKVPSCHKLLRLERRCRSVELSICMSQTLELGEQVQDNLPACHKLQRLERCRTIYLHVTNCRDGRRGVGQFTCMSQTVETGEEVQDNLSACHKLQRRERRCRTIYLHVTNFRDGRGGVGQIDLHVTNFRDERGGEQIYLHVTNFRDERGSVGQFTCMSQTVETGEEVQEKCHITLLSTGTMSALDGKLTPNRRRRETIRILKKKENLLFTRQKSSASLSLSLHLNLIQISM